MTAIKKYSFNLIRLQRIEQKRTNKINAIVKTMQIVALISLLFSVLFYAYKITNMQKILNNKKSDIARINKEYENYQKTQIIISKDDIETLNRLHSNRIFWTHHFEVIAKFIPADYWITKLTYHTGQVEITGSGVYNSNQNQAVEVISYINKLRNYSSFTKDFPNITFNNVALSGDSINEIVQFQFTAEKETPMMEDTNEIK